MSSQGSSNAVFGAIVFFGTATVGLLTLLLIERRRTDPSEDGLTTEERVNVSVYAEASRSVVHLVSSGRTLLPSSENSEQEPSSGSGIIWDDRGLVVTNDHLIRDRLQGQVILPGGKPHEVLYVGSDQAADIAVLFVQDLPEQWTPARRGLSSELRVGQRVFAIGNPFGLDQSLSVGVVSGLGRRVQGYFSGSIHEGVIQTDAAVNPGNSGGPLVDSRGRVVGINTSIVGDLQASAGVGFAIPVETIEAVLPAILNQGFEPWPEIGLILAPDGFEAQWGWTEENGPFGLVPIQVLEGSPAFEAGIMAVGVERESGAKILFDRIVQVDGVAIEQRSTASDIFATKVEGDTVQLTVARGMPPQFHTVPLQWGAR